MLRKLDEDCKKSWDYLRVIAKHESSSSIKPRYEVIMKWPCSSTTENLLRVLFNYKFSPRMTEFLADAGERITILKVVCRRVINR